MTDKAREKWKNCLRLFAAFFKIGAFTFGGGYAMIALIENEVVEKKKWITHDTMMDIVVVAESTPGPVAINTATFVGYRLAGAPGSAAATFGVVLPSFVIIFLISSFLENFLEITWVANAFRGIQAAVAYLICNAGWKMLKKTEKKVLPITVFALALAAMIAINLFDLSFSVIWMILGGLALGFFLLALKKWQGREKK